MHFPLPRRNYLNAFATAPSVLKNKVISFDVLRSPLQHPLPSTTISPSSSNAICTCISCLILSLSSSLCLSVGFHVISSNILHALSIFRASRKRFLMIFFARASYFPLSPPSSRRAKCLFACKVRYFGPVSKRGNAEETSMKMEMEMGKRKGRMVAKRKHQSFCNWTRQAGKSNRRTLFLTYVNLHKCPHKSDKWVPFALLQARLPCDIWLANE